MNINNKTARESGVCRICFRVIKLITNTGTLYNHGPPGVRCPGAYQPPINENQESNRLNISDKVNNNIENFPVDSQIPSFKSFSQDKLISQDNSSFVHPTCHRQLIKHIPKAARITCGHFLSNILTNIVTNPNDINGWKKLFKFGPHILSKPEHGGKRHNLISIIKSRIANFDRSDLNVFNSSNIHNYPAKPINSQKLLNKAIISKIEDGNFKSAVRLICSNDQIAVNDSSALQKLIEKHPKRPTNRFITPPSNRSPPLSLSESDVYNAIQSFPPGSSGGPDGLTPQHLKNLICTKEISSTLLSTITNFCNLILSGKCHYLVTPYFFGGRLIALRKKDDSIRPIAIGYLWRRLCSKCANSFAIKKVKSYLFPRQIGVGIPGGCEAAVHASRRLLNNLPDSNVFVKLDFSNAFNSIRRDHLLKEVSTFIPELELFCHQAYSDTSILKYGDSDINSEEGIQQGDPLGPLLFCLSIQPILNSLKSEFNISYLDDVSLSGNIDTVKKDLDFIIKECKLIGLELNPSKCEIISNSESPLDFFTHFNRTPINHATLLGSPLTSNESMTITLAKSINSFNLAMNRLQYLPSHYSYIILKSALCTPKLLYILRTSPCLGHPALNEFDILLKKGISLITNNNLDEISWLQASLPIREGGLGIRSAVSLAPSAFIASAASTYALQSSLLEKINLPDDPDVIINREYWQKTYKTDIPDSSSAHFQKAWDRGSINTTLNTILNYSSDNREKARLIAVRAPHSSDWLNAYPLPSCGMFLDNESFRVAIGLRLGLNICLKHQCLCGVIVDEKGTHCLSCKKIIGRIPRHQNLNDIIWRSMQLAEIPSSKEPAGLSTIDGKRPDGVTLIPWKAGKCLAWDVTVADTFATSYLNSTSIKAGSAADTLALKKINKYSSLNPSLSFIPIALESMGPIATCTLEFFKQLCSRINLITSDNNAMPFFFQRISLNLQRFNAVCFKSSFFNNFEARAEY